MRLKSTLQQYFNLGVKSNLKVVRQYQRKYERIAALLAANPELARLAHRDWAGKLSTSRSGRRAAYSCEEILKALVVMFVEQKTTGRRRRHGRRVRHSRRDSASGRGRRGRSHC